MKLLLKLTALILIICLSFSLLAACNQELPPPAPTASSTPLPTGSASPSGTYQSNDKIEFSEILKKFGEILLLLTGEDGELEVSFNEFKTLVKSNLDDVIIFLDSFDVILLK